MSTIQLKRSLTTAIPASLANGEIAYSANGDIGYIGSNGGIIAIFGKRVPGVLTANQALVVNSTSGIDKFLTSNLTLSGTSVNTINLVSNTTVLGSASNNELTSTWAIKTYIDGKVAGAAGSPGGANTQIQFDDSGSFGGDATFTWNKTTGSLLVGNSTTNTTITAASLALNGTAIVVNSIGAFIGANVNVGLSGVVVGNSTINAFMNSSTLTFNAGQVVVNNSIIQNGANVIIDTAKMAFGNSTVNTTINSLAFAINGVQTVNATGVSAGLLYGSQVNSTANISFTGANVSIPNANLAVKDLNVSGNLVVSGTVTTVDATNLQVKDSMIKLADQNASDAIDIGFYGLYNDGSNRFTGLFRDASNAGRYILYANNLAEPTTTVDTANLSFAIATLQSYLISGNLVSNSSGVAIGANSTYAVTLVANSLTLTTALVGTSGGTGKATVASLSLLTGNTTNGYNELSFSATDGAILQGNTTAIRWDSVIDCGTF